MKVYFLGSAVTEKTADYILMHSKVKPSVAPIYFQNNAIRGLAENGIFVESHSLPPIKAFPSGCYKAWGRRHEKLDCGTENIWLPVINVQGLKQLCASVSTYFSVLHWLISNRKDKDKVLLSYSIYAPCTAPATRLAKRFGCKSCAVITDLVDYVYRDNGSVGLKARLLRRMRERTKRLRGSFDGYVFLTKYMINLYKASEKPYIIMEGFCNNKTFSDVPDVPPKEKADAVMYCGALSRGFGIDRLCDAFMKTQGTQELWLFGSGECEEYIKKCAEKDGRIKFMGRAPRHELLAAEKKARLLINVKPSAEEHTKFAFPSKILEYMSSGTAVLTTKIGGIPDEYYDYVYTIEDESTEGIAAAIEETFACGVAALCEKGAVARAFVLGNKNQTVQGERIAGLLREIVEK